MTITRAHPPLPSHGREAVFVDAACADLMQLLAGRNDGREIIPLDSPMPLAEMAAWAVGRSGYAAIHIVSHGAPGRLFLGPTVLDADAARLHAAELATLGAALDAHGSVLLYGCDVARGAGAAFADLLAGLLGASVAASTTPTGAAALGGDWTLAWASGPVHATPLRADAWHGVLVAPQLQSVTAYANQQVITLTYDQPLDALNPPQLGVFLAQNIPTPGGYGEGQITINGTDVNISSVTVSGNTVIIDMGGPFAPGDILGFSYYDDGSIDDEAAIQNAAGEDAGTAVFNLVADFAPPSGPSVTSIVNAAGNVFVPASATAIDYTVTFSENVNGVDLGDFELAPSGSATGTLANISGSGATYTITINGLAGDGKLGLNLKDTGTGIESDSKVAITAGFTGEAVTLDHTAPGAPGALTLSAASDSGTPGDGITNVYPPTVTGTAESNATVTLYDTDGATVVGSTKADGSGNWSITAVAPLAVGSHSLSAKQTDVAGNVSAASATLSYVLDPVGPTDIALSATTVTQAAAVSGATIATLSATDTSAIGYAFATGNGTIDADNGKFSIVGNDLVAAENLTAGDYQIYVSATDAAGNPAYQVFTISVSDTPAVAGIVRAASAPETVPASATSVAYTVSFNQAVTGVDASDFTLNTTGSASGAIDSVVDSGDGITYTVTVDSVLGDGALRLDLNASGTGIENAANVAIAGGYTSGATFQLDRTVLVAPSAVSMTAASDTGELDNDGITSNPTPTFTGTGEPNTTVQLFDTDGTTLLGSASADSKGNWSVTSSILSEGNHTLTVRQQDAAGNLSPASATLSVVIDATADAPGTPALASASDSGVAGDNITNVTAPTITGTAEADAAITLYDTDGVTVIGTATASNTGTWSIVTSTLAEGSHTLSAVQRDRAGNLSAASAALTLAIDTQAPETPPGIPVLAAASDSGTLGDNITNVGRPVLTGTAAANARVTLYDTDGATVLGTADADSAGNWSILSSTLAIGEHTLSAKQADAAGNLSAAGAPLSLTIEAPPPPPPVTPPSGTIDGVPVTQQPVTLPGGGAGTQVTIPVITPDRIDNSGNAGVADIPLAISNGANLLLAQLPVGVGLSATGGAAAPAGDPLQHLIQAIVGATPGYDPQEQGHLTGNGLTFLGQLSASVPLLVQTIVPGSGAATPAGALTLTGTSTPELHTALVIDTRGLAPDTTLQLNAVDFAAIVGAANVGAATPGQILSGDQAAQRFTVTGDSASALFAGGGNDTLVFDTTTVAPAPPPENAAGATGAALAALAGIAMGGSLLHGGLDVDSASFSGNLDSYTVERHQSYVTVTSIAQPAQSATVINAESLVFADTTVAIEHGDAISAIAGLYRDTLGRQADYLGIDFWTQGVADGVSLGRIALDIIASPESQEREAKVFNGDHAHDLDILYQAIFSRDGDAEGVAFWSAALDAGATLEQVAAQFMVSQEIATHTIDAARWDFLVL